MEYDKAIEYMNKSFDGTHKKGLEVVKEILKLTKNPQNDLQIIHIAGTNGKGSTSSMLNNILTEEGYKVGLFTSPHVERPNERLRINNEPISDGDFAHEMLSVKKLTDLYFQREGETLSFFEIFTIMAFTYFKREKVDYVILEAGIGGLEDATNVTEKSLLSVITSISFDHIDILGDTLSEIAIQKAGIIKNDTPVVLYYNNDSVKNIISDIAKSKNAPFFYVGDDLEINITELNSHKSIYGVKNKFINYDKIELRLIGEYQIYNSITALLCVEALRKCGVEISESSVLNGLKKAQWAGRMEIFNLDNKEILLEGAHNLDAIMHLKKSLQNFYKNKKIILVMGVLKDKECDKMFLEISGEPDEIILTSPNSARAKDPREITIYDADKTEIIANNKDAITKALRDCDGESIVCVTGSLYLIGDARRIILDLGGKKYD